MDPRVKDEVNSTLDFNSCRFKKFLRPLAGQRAGPS